MNRGVSPKIWGPAGWRVIHEAARQASAAGSAKDAVPVEFVAFMESLAVILPCPTCRRNFTTHYRSLPMSPKLADLNKWVWRLHHRVNGTRSVPSWPEVKRTICGCSDGSGLGPAEAAPFLEAVVETHPGAWYITADYVMHSANFWRTVAGVIGIKPPSEEALLSRKEMRGYLRRQGVSKKNVAATVCAIDAKDACGVSSA